MPRKPRFSERVGAVRSPTTVQVGHMTVELKNCLWNWIARKLFYGSWKLWKAPVEIICDGFFKLPVDSLPPRVYPHKLRDWLRERYFRLEWHETYNLLEFIVQNAGDLRGTLTSGEAAYQLNEMLEGELSGYRFVEGMLVPIANEQEIESIEEALRLARQNYLYGTAQHFRTALRLMAQKPNPDHRNSIKESVSAVESLVKQLAGEKGGGLSRALRKLDDKVKLHPSFRVGLEKLYGYSSDEDGIRHAILEKPNVGFDEAKFMLVACSAFVNFIIAKANEHALFRRTTGSG